MSDDPNLDGIDVDNAVEVVVNRVVRDEGTIVVFAGESGDEDIHFAVDHRPAQDLARGLADDDELPIVYVEPWQIINRRNLNNGRS